MLKLRTKIEAISLVSLLVILSFSSAWAVTRNIQSNKETISGGTYFYSGSYDFINNSHFNLSNKIYNSIGSIYNATVKNIQLAINDLPSTGGSMSVPAGNYFSSSGIDLRNNTKITFNPGVHIELTDSSVRIGSNVTLIMYGAKITLRSSTGYGHLYGIRTWSPCRDSIIMGGEINGNSSTGLEPQNHQTECIRTCSQAYGAGGSGTSHLIIRDMYLHDASGSMIIACGKGIVIENCRFANSTYDHAIYASGGANTFNSTGIHVKNCDFSGYYHDTPIQFSCADSSVEQCYFHNFLQNPNATLEQHYWFVQKDDSPNMVISGNTVNTSDKHSSVVFRNSNVVFSDNVLNLNGSSYDCIITSFDYTVSNITISNNIIKNFGDGIAAVYGIHLSNISDCLIFNNNIYSDKATSRGIYISTVHGGSKNIMISNNKIHTPIYSMREGGGGGSIENVTITGNIIDGDWTSSSDLKNAMIQGNVITGTPPSYSSNSNVIVRDNLGSEDLEAHYFYPSGVNDSARFKTLLDSVDDGDKIIFLPGWYNWSYQFYINKPIDIYLMPGVNITVTKVVSLFNFGGGSSHSIVHGYGTLYGNNTALDGTKYLISTTPTTDNITVDGIVCSSSMFACIYMESSNNTRILNVDFTGNTASYDIYNYGSKGTLVENCYSNSNAIFYRSFYPSSSYCIVKDNKIFGYHTYGIYLENISKSQVSGNIIKNSANGIYLKCYVDNCSLSDNIIFNATTATAGINIAAYVNNKNNTLESNRITGFSYGIRSYPNAWNYIFHNDILGCTTSISLSYPLVTIVRDNIGYKTENNGNTSVANNGTISHGLATTPTVVLLTSNYANLSFMCMKKSSTTFTVIIRDINTHTTPSGSYYVMWYAKV